MKESFIERKFAQACRAHGALCYKFVSPSNRGVPDRIVVTPDGRVTFVELKTMRGHLSGLQKYEISRLRDHGCAVWVCAGLESALRSLDVICGRKGASVPPRRAKALKSKERGGAQ